MKKPKGLKHFHRVDLEMFARRSVILMIWDKNCPIDHPHFPDLARAFPGEAIAFCERETIYQCEGRHRFASVIVLSADRVCEETLVHELFHSVASICGFLGIGIDIENDETPAYMLSHLYGEFSRSLKRAGIKLRRQQP